MVGVVAWMHFCRIERHKAFSVAKAWVLCWFGVLTLSVLTAAPQSDGAADAVLCGTMAAVWRRVQLIGVAIIGPLLFWPLVRDKASRALEHLLLTAASDWEVALGLWLGAAAHVWLFQALLVPPMLLLAWASRWPFLAGLAGALAPLSFTPIAVGFGLVAAIESRILSTSLTGSYLALAPACLFWEGLDMPWPAPGLSPEWAFYRGATGLVTGLACVGWSAWRLRATCMPQLIPEASWWSRPPVGDSSVRWRERWAGPSGLPLVPRVPLWLAVVVIGGLVGWAQWDALSANSGPGFLQLPAQARPYSQAILALIRPALVIVLLVCLAAVRATASVPWECEKETWEALCLTPLESSELLSQKADGIMDAVMPCHVAVLLASLPAAWVCGPAYLIMLLMVWSLGWAVLGFVVTHGLVASLEASNRWVEAGSALALAYFGCVAALGVASAGATFFCSALPAFIKLLVRPDDPPSFEEPSFAQFVVSAWAVVIGALIAMRNYSLRRGTAILDERFRTQHAAEGPQP